MGGSLVPPHGGRIIVEQLKSDCWDAIAQNFCHSECVFNGAWAQYNIPNLCNEVSKQVIVTRVKQHALMFNA
jgi:hypothetical protein